MEIWKDIKGYEGFYQVSNLGNVKSIERLVYHSRHGTQTILSRVLKPTKRKGYLGVVLSKNAITKPMSIQRLVAIAFLENPYNKPQVNHINGIKIDNRLENLEWVTIYENHYHSLITGLKPKGSLVSNSKLTDKKVLEILSIKDVSNEKIAFLYNVHKSTITAIKSNRAWKHIKR